ncbi:MAG: hypothetical protein JWN17_725 [Frankiales bacterium]|nr:hypothetical protein [Frankiales bacterium]
MTRVPADGRMSEGQRAPREISWMIFTGFFAVVFIIPLVLQPHWGGVLAILLMVGAGVASVKAERATFYFVPGLKPSTYLPEGGWRLLALLCFVGALWFVVPG